VEKGVFQEGGAGGGRDRVHHSERGGPFQGVEVGPPQPDHKGDVGPKK